MPPHFWIDLYQGLSFFFPCFLIFLCVLTCNAFVTKHSSTLRVRFTDVGTRLILLTIVALWVIFLRAITQNYAEYPYAIVFFLVLMIIYTDLAPKKEDLDVVYFEDSEVCEVNMVTGCRQLKVKGNPCKLCDFLDFVEKGYSTYNWDSNIYRNFIFSMEKSFLSGKYNVIQTNTAASGIELRNLLVEKLINYSGNLPGKPIFTQITIELDSDYAKYNGYFIKEAFGKLPVVTNFTAEEILTMFKFKSKDLMLLYMIEQAINKEHYNET